MNFWVLLSMWFSEGVASEVSVWKEMTMEGGPMLFESQKLCEDLLLKNWDYGVYTDEDNKAVLERTPKGVDVIVYNLKTNKPVEQHVCMPLTVPFPK